MVGSPSTARGVCRGVIPPVAGAVQFCCEAKKGCVVKGVVFAAVARSTRLAR